MGCLKITYQPQMQVLRTRKLLQSHEAKVVQLWQSVDPMAHLREWVSPYNFVQNNPINRVDPTGALDDWYETPSGEIKFDANIKSQADLTTAGIEGTYLGPEGFGLNPETGMAVHYQADGTTREFAQTLGGTTVTPDYSYSTNNPSISSHNKSGLLWDNRDLAVFITLKDHKSPIGTVVRKQVETGNFDILSADRYWQKYGHTLGNMMLMDSYIGMADMISGPDGPSLSRPRTFNPSLVTSKPQLTNNNIPAPATFSDFLKTQKGKDVGIHTGRGSWMKAKSQEYKLLKSGGQ